MMGSARARTDVPPIDHALKASLLQVDRAQRAAQAAFGAARLFSPESYGATFEALWGIGDAARGRLEDMQKGWVDDWFTWLKYARQIEGAGTVSKLAERELNIVNQAVQLVSEQTVGLLTLANNVEVDVLYLLTEQPLAPEPFPEPAIEPAPPPLEAAANDPAPVETTIAPEPPPEPEVIAAPEMVVAPEITVTPESAAAPEATVALESAIAPEPESAAAPEVIDAPELVVALETATTPQLIAAPKIPSPEPPAPPQPMAAAPPKPPAPARPRPKGPPKGSG